VTVVDSGNDMTVVDSGNESGDEWSNVEYYDPERVQIL
jgi:hypothetical protein